MIIPVTSVVADQTKHEITVSCGGDYVITEADFLKLDIASTGQVELEKLIFCADKLSCIKKAQDYLSYSDVSEKKLKEKLKNKFSVEVIEKVVDLLKEKGYIDDERLAERFASELARTRKWGKIRIEQYLYTKGFSRENIVSASENLDDDMLEENLREYVSKNVCKYCMTDRASRAKFANSLYRLGYTWESINSVLSEYE